MISIIVICHNYGRFLKKCVKSILLNEKKYIKEILIIDDSSKDDTKEIALDLKKKTQLIKYFRKNFNSLSKSTNFGIKKSKSKWVTKIDADDYISKSFLKVFYDELSKKKLDFIYGNIIMNDKLRKKKRIINQGNLKSKIFKYPMGSGTIFNKSVWSSVGGFDEKLYYQDDYDFWLRINKKKFNIGYFNKALYCYQKHSENMSNSLFKKNLTKMYVFFKNII
jgi:glycosyltransferase involved in cell wall biosynthesis